VDWHEITAAGDWMTISRADVPATSRSAPADRLPEGMLSSPLDQQLARSGRLRRILFAEGHRISTPVPPPLLKVLERR
jgi:hypothetical protein